MFVKRQNKPVVLDNYFPNPKGGYRRYRERKNSQIIGKLSFWLSFVVISCLCLLSDKVWAINLEKEGLNHDAYQAGQLLVQASGTSQDRSALMLSSNVDFRVSGLQAHATLKQDFQNQTSEWVNGKYVFPLPENSAVKKLKITVGERIIIGRVEEKSTAKKIFNKAVSDGKLATLVEQHRPNLFTMNVANIPPGEIVEVELVYLQSVKYDGGYFSLRFPMTITPRYFPGNALANIQKDNNKDLELEMFQDIESTSTLYVDPNLGWAVDTDIVPDASKISPYLSPNIATQSELINPITITASINMGMPLRIIESAYHDIMISKKNDRYDVKLTNGKVSMNQDFVMTWRPELGKEPKAAVFKESLGEDDYLMLMVMPPSTMVDDHESFIDKKVSVFPREVIYIIDTSGSMDGVSIRQAKQSLLLAIDDLHPEDHFNIIEFNSKTSSLFNQAMPSNEVNLLRAKHYISSLNSGGGTEMLPALELALRDQSDSNVVRQVVFITDGAVGNEQDLFSAIHKNLGSSRLFTVGIGSAPNSYFMRKVAQFGKGTFTHIGDIAEIQQVMSQLFSKLNAPQMTDISVDWSDGVVTDSYPRLIPDLYKGEPLMISVKIKDPASKVTISGKLRNRIWEQTIDVINSADQQGISTLWAREKIASLLDEKIAGRDAQEVRSDVLSVALKHQIVSPYSSFVAVEQQRSRPVSETLKSVSVNNARPKGQGPQTFAYPNTATRAQQSLFTGLILLILLLVCSIFKRLPLNRTLFPC